MKKLLLIVSWVVAGVMMASNSNAQTLRNCGTMTHYLEMLQQDPSFAKSQQKIENQIQRIINQNPNYRVNGMVTIPVVVHVIYKTAAQNIPDNRIFEQINVLNDDYARTNADTTNTPSVFVPVAANTNIQFCMAQRDPSGNPTTGIDRVLTTVTSWTTNDAVKYTAQGGANAWDRNSYLNLWVCNLGSGLLGYAQFPGGAAATDGVVVLYSSVGGPNAPGTITSYDLGRTATHEVGHWLNLRHINGDANCGSDLVADTPTQSALNFGCPNFPHVTCSNGPNGDMFQNYMDYTDDACMNIFTVGQGARMNALFAVGGARVSILSSLGCTPVIAQNNDAGVFAITSPSGTVCSSTIAPIITLRNYGLTTLTSVDINYDVDGGTVNTYPWTGSLATNATTSVTLPSISVSAGAHVLTVYTSNPNGTADQDATNDSQSGNFNSAATAAAIPFVEGFEAGTFPPAGWTLDNPDGATTWAQYTTAGHTGTHSMWMDNANYNANGEIDNMSMQPVDISTVSNPELTFWVAYKLWTDPTSVPNFSDTLEVLVSTDCGLTFTSLYKNYGVALTTTTPSWANADFLNPTASQWRKETINLAAYASSTGAIFMFRNITDYENNLYIDDINIDQATGINVVSSDPTFSLYPVPSKGMVNLRWGASVKESVSITITNSIGELVYNRDIKNYNGELVKLNMSKNANGIYFIKAQSGNTVINQKILLNK